MTSSFSINRMCAPSKFLQSWDLKHLLDRTYLWKPASPTQTFTLLVDCRQCRKMKGELLATYVECRKLDVAVNTLMSRGRRVSFPSPCCFYITSPNFYWINLSFSLGRSMKPAVKPKAAPKSKKEKSKPKSGTGKKDKPKGKSKTKKEEASGSEKSEYDEEPATRRRRKAS